MIPMTFPAPIEVADMTQDEAISPAFRAAMLKVERCNAALDKRLRKAAAKVGEQLVDGSIIDYSYLTVEKKCA